MKNKTLLLWFLAFLPLLVTIVVLPMLPDQIPAHYDSNGIVDRWGSKYESLIVPIITIVIISVLLFIGEFIKRQKDISESNEKVLDVVKLVVVIVFNGLTYWFLYTAFTQVEDLNQSKLDALGIFSVLLSISFVFLGNILPKCKQNMLIGIRTKWTLQNEEVWYKTHRVGGFVLFTLGILLTGLSLTVVKGWSSMFVVLGSFLLVAIVITVYSFVIFQKYQGIEGAKRR